MPESEVQDIASEAEVGAETLEAAAQPETVMALEPATLPSHPLRAMDVPCFIPKLIG
ncbi:hypothetical protein GCM10009839_14090 [Catenulispora yoronensis]|uniref:Uncharacterized protein n=1 Tax=Catenulispora yoronensis TaxID=450799 RepID=A0ABN2TSF5_9ACTN